MWFQTKKRDDREGALPSKRISQSDRFFEE
jgi:hypothetical protein